MFSIEKFNQNRYGTEYSPDISDEARIAVCLKLAGENKKILDVGCWNGYIGGLFKSHHNYVVGLEGSMKAVGEAALKLDRVIHVDLNGNWASEVDEKFDVVFCGEIIEHILDTDLFLDNTRKVLDNNGILIVSTPNIASLGRRFMLLLGKSPNTETTLRMRDSGHIRYFTINTLSQLLKEHGYKVRSKTSNIVNFSGSGKYSSKFLAKIIPQFGTTLIVSACKMD